MCKISTGKSPLAGRETWLPEGCLAPWLKYALGRDPEVKSHLLLGARNELKLKVAGFNSLGQNDILSLRVLRIARSLTVIEMGIQKRQPVLAGALRGRERLPALSYGWASARSKEPTASQNPSSLSFRSPLSLSPTPPSFVPCSHPLLPGPYHSAVHASSVYICFHFYTHTGHPQAQH